MILTGSRGSPLARAQFYEAQSSIPFLLKPIWVETIGDREQTVSLRDLNRTDFFTKELDEMLLAKQIRLAIHSAKDLPDPLPLGLSVVAMTPSIDPRDSLVLRPEESLTTLLSGAKIATSSKRREDAVRKLRSDLCFVDLRGTIHQRLSKIETGDADGVVVAEAALIRLQLTHLNRIFMESETAANQGCLAIVARSEDLEMKDFFAALFRS